MKDVLVALLVAGTLAGIALASHGRGCGGTETVVNMVIAPAILSMAAANWLLTGKPPPQKSICQ